MTNTYLAFTCMNKEWQGLVQGVTGSGIGSIIYMNLIQGVAGYGSWFDKVKVDLSGVIVGQTGSLIVYHGLYIVGLPWVKGGYTGYTCMWDHSGVNIMSYWVYLLGSEWVKLISV